MKCDIKDCFMATNPDLTSGELLSGNFLCSWIWSRACLSRWKNALWETMTPCPPRTRFDRISLGPHPGPIEILWLNVDELRFSMARRRQTFLHGKSQQPTNCWKSQNFIVSRFRNLSQSPWKIIKFPFCRFEAFSGRTRWWQRTKNVSKQSLLQFSLLSACFAGVLIVYGGEKTSGKFLMNSLWAFVVRVAVGWWLWGRPLNLLFEKFERRESDKRISRIWARKLLRQSLNF